MPPRRRTPAPIPVDIEGVRRKLAEGKIVRVGISKSAQFPDGATGRVRHVGDPAVDGEEFVQVELSLNGMRDVLPFTPADLTPATRGRPAGSSNPAGGPGPGKASTGARAAGTAKRARTLTSVPTGDMLADSVARQQDSADPDTGATPSVAAKSAAVPVPGGAPMSGGTGAASGGAASAGAVSAGAVSAGGASPPVKRQLATDGSADGPDQRSAAGQSPGRPKQARGPRRTPAVAITIATTDTEPAQWKIEARVGARVALRSGSVAPARVWELVRLLENEALTKAVGTILDDQRRAAQARADSLAAELAQVRAELEALPDGSK